MTFVPATTGGRMRSAFITQISSALICCADRVPGKKIQAKKQAHSRLIFFMIAGLKVINYLHPPPLPARHCNCCCNCYCNSILLLPLYPATANCQLPTANYFSTALFNVVCTDRAPTYRLMESPSA